MQQTISSLVENTTEAWPSEITYLMIKKKEKTESQGCQPQKEITIIKIKSVSVVCVVVSWAIEL